MPYTQEQIEEAKEFVRYHSQWFEANALSKVLVILAALESAEQKIILHIQDHDDLMQHNGTRPARPSHDRHSMRHHNRHPPAH